MKLYINQKKFHRFSNYWSSFIGVIFFFLLVTPADAYDLLLQWDPNSEPDVAGYLLYIDDGTANSTYEYFETYTLEDIDPDNPSSIITGLQNDQDYSFVLTAYNTEGNESDYSEVICVNNGLECASSVIVGDSSTSGSSGGGGGECFISSSVHATPTHSALITWFLFTLSFCIVIASILRLRTKKKLLETDKVSACLLVHKRQA